MKIKIFLLVVISAILIGNLTKGNVTNIRDYIPNKETAIKIAEAV
jgi:hypothetical protein